jgi:hypothetical protein
VISICRYPALRDRALRCVSPKSQKAKSQKPSQTRSKHRNKTPHIDLFHKYIQISAILFFMEIVWNNEQFSISQCKAALRQWKQSNGNIETLPVAWRTLASAETKRLLVIGVLGGGPGRVHSNAQPSDHHNNEYKTEDSGLFDLHFTPQDNTLWIRVATQLPLGCRQPTHSDSDRDRDRDSVLFSSTETQRWKRKQAYRRVLLRSMTLLFMCCHHVVLVSEPRFDLCLIDRLKVVHAAIQHVADSGAQQRVEQHVLRASGKRIPTGTLYDIGLHTPSLSVHIRPPSELKTDSQRRDFERTFEASIGSLLDGSQLSSAKRKVHSNNTLFRIVPFRFVGGVVLERDVRKTVAAPVGPVQVSLDTYPAESDAKLYDQMSSSQIPPGVSLDAAAAAAKSMWDSFAVSVPGSNVPEWTVPASSLSPMVCADSVVVSPASTAPASACDFPDTFEEFVMSPQFGAAIVSSAERNRRFMEKKSDQMNTTPMQWMHWMLALVDEGLLHEMEAMNSIFDAGLKPLIAFSELRCQQACDEVTNMVKKYPDSIDAAMERYHAIACGYATDEFAQQLHDSIDCD